MGNDTDPDTGLDGTLDITLVGSSYQGGTAVINGTNIDYTQADCNETDESFTYTIRDQNGAGLSSTATVTVTVNESTSITRNNIYNYDNVLVNDSDPDGHQIRRLSASAAVTGGSTTCT